MTETTSTAFGFDEFFDHLEVRLNHWDQNQLSQTLANFQGEILVAAVPARNHQRALVIGVDQADQVTQHDAVLMAQAGARQDQRRQAGSPM